VNVGHLPNSDALEKVVTATLRASFPVVVRDAVSDTNSLVIGSAAPVSGSRMLRSAESGSARELLPVGLTVADRFGDAVRGGRVYTDDRAPVEWLTDLSILQYATGKR
jgi:hypothetical protein